MTKTATKTYRHIVKAWLRWDFWLCRRRFKGAQYSPQATDFKLWALLFPEKVPPASERPGSPSQTFKASLKEPSLLFISIRSMASGDWSIPSLSRCQFGKQLVIDLDKIKSLSSKNTAESDRSRHLEQMKGPRFLLCRRTLVSLSWKFAPRWANLQSFTVESD